MASANGTTIGLGRPASRADASTDRPAPGYAAAQAAGLGFPGFVRDFHPICFCCRRGAPGSGVQAFVGPLEGAPEGDVAGAWTPHPSFAGTDGLIGPEVIWTALDCPGSVAWVLNGEGQGGALGAMTCEIRRRPAAGEPCILAAWRIGAERRKRLSGTALYSAAGELLASSRQVWIFPAAAA
jgi:hypothetical protein